MKQTNIVGKVGILISFSMLFLVATYFGKAVNYLDVGLFAVGLILGIGLLELDERLLYQYYDPEDKKLATRSALFLLTLFPLGLFLLTSTGSPTGVGMFLGIISGLSLEFYNLRNDLEQFQQRYLYQLKRDIAPDEHKIVTLVCISLTFIYAFLVIFLGR
jgi:hypothetical protein